MVNDFVSALRASLVEYWGTHLQDELGPAFLKLVSSLILILIASVAARVVDATLRRSLAWADTHVCVLLRRLAQVGVVVTTALMVLAVWGVDTTALVAVFGVAGLALSLAFQDLLRNLVAGFYVLMERPFRIGDVVDIKGGGIDTSGRIEDIRLRTTQLRTVSGYRAIVPNAAMLAMTVVTNRSAYGTETARIRLTVPLPGAGTRGEEEAAPVVPRPELDGIEAAAAQAVHEAGFQLDTPPPLVVIESMGPGKATLRVEFCAADRLPAASSVARRLRQVLPDSEVTVLE